MELEPRLAGRLWSTPVYLHSFGGVCFLKNPGGLIGLLSAAALSGMAIDVFREIGNCRLSGGRGAMPYDRSVAARGWVTPDLGWWALSLF